MGDEQDDDEERVVPRSHLRDQARAYLDLAEQLVKKPRHLPEPPFDDELRQAIAEARHLTKSARTRQIRLVAQLLRRMSGVLDTRDARLLLMQVAGAALAQVLELLPEGQPPTVTRVEGVDDRLSLQALCRGRPSWQQLEAIKRAGASGLMVLPVEQMLA